MAGPIPAAAGISVPAAAPTWENQAMNTVRVEYVGPKPSHLDHLYGTALVWEGKGTQHDVPAEAWEGMKKHTDVYRLVEAPLDIPDAKRMGSAAKVPLAVLPDTTPAQAPAEAAQAGGKEPTGGHAEERPTPSGRDDLTMPDLDLMTDAQVKIEAAKRGLKIDNRLRGPRLHTDFLKHQGKP